VEALLKRESPKAVLATVGMAVRVYRHQLQEHQSLARVEAVAEFIRLEVEVSEVLVVVEMVRRMV